MRALPLLATAALGVGLAIAALGPAATPREEVGALPAPSPMVAAARPSQVRTPVAPPARPAAAAQAGEPPAPVEVLETVDLVDPEAARLARRALADDLARSAFLDHLDALAADGSVPDDILDEARAAARPWE